MSLDKLESVLNRALKKASLVQQADLKRRLLKKRAAQANADKAISVDFTHRLQDRAKFRDLLADDRLDAARFRFYFSSKASGITVDEARRMIDRSMNNAKTG